MDYLYIKKIPNITEKLLCPIICSWIWFTINMYKFYINLYYGLLVALILLSTSILITLAAKRSNRCFYISAFTIYLIYFILISIIHIIIFIVILIQNNSYIKKFLNFLKYTRFNNVTEQNIKDNKIAILIGLSIVFIFELILMIIIIHYKKIFSPRKSYIDTQPIIDNTEIV